MTACLYIIDKGQKLFTATGGHFPAWTGVQFDTSKDEVGDSGKDEAQLEANVHAIGTDQFSDGSHIVDLIGTK